MLIIDKTFADSIGLKGEGELSADGVGGYVLKDMPVSFSVQMRVHLPPRKLPGIWVYKSSDSSVLHLILVKAGYSDISDSHKAMLSPATRCIGTSPLLFIDGISYSTVPLVQSSKVRTIVPS